MKLNACIIIKILDRNENDIFIMANKDGSIAGFKNTKCAYDYIHNMYKHYFNINRQFTAAACIHLTQLEYAVQSFNNPQDKIYI